MAESSIPVDLFNPGQVFACLGLVEATEILVGGAAGAFDWSGADVRFRVCGAGDEKPVERVLSFIEEAKVVTRVPADSPPPAKWTKSWGDNPLRDEIGSPFPFPAPDSPATLPSVLRDASGAEVAVDYWGDATKRDNVKFWAGSAGYPGAALLRDAIELASGRMRQYANDPFALSAPQTSSFRFDWRRDYIPVDAGFSPNKHGKLSMVGFPVVELLAAIGVTHARPDRVNKLEYRYGVMGGASLLDPLLLRAALGAESPPVPGALFRRFTMHLDWPGQEGQARCITNVTEEMPDDHRN